MVSPIAPAVVVPQPGTERVPSNGRWRGRESDFSEQVGNSYLEMDVSSRTMMQTSHYGLDPPTTTERVTRATPATSATVAAIPATHGRNRVNLNFVDIYKTHTKEEDDSGAPLLGEHHGKEHVGLSVFGFFKLVTIATTIYMVTVTCAGYNPDTGHICPRPVICATTTTQQVLLIGSRFMTGVLFPSLAISVASKCNASRAYLHHSWLGTVLDLEPAHDLHIYFGYLTLLAGWAHGILHLARVVCAGEPEIMYKTHAFRSGIVAMLLLLPIVLPMRLAYLRKKINYQLRKAMHMLFLVMLVALCFHGKKFRYVGSILLMGYLVDSFYFTTKQTFLVTHATYEAIGRGTMVGIDLPESYQFKAGSYFYVNCPAIDRAEWHPFSLIPVPGAPSRAAFYAEAVGDWTKDLFRLGLANPSQPLWITAAQPSLVETTLYYDNVLLICTGAGITPAVAVADRFATKKNIHLMWMARDHGMIALFERQLRMVTSTVHLTGNPKDDIKEAMSRLLSRSTNKFCTKKGKWVGDAEAGEMLTHRSLQKLTHSPSPSVGFKSVSGHKRQHSQGTVSEFGDARERIQEDSAGWGEHGDMPPPVSHDVTLNFGRPDIAKYILDALNATPSAAITTSGYTTGWPNAERGRQRAPTRKVTEHLDDGQKMSRNKLIRADSSTVKNIKMPGDLRVTGGETAREIKHKSFPWIVIYCGANAKVEEVIASTCGELNVTWRKEYFGAW